jgi:hypothetical protein
MADFPRLGRSVEDCIFCIADEAYWGGDKRCVGRFQGMITEPTLTIERKGFDAYSAKNFLHILMLAEPGWVIPAGRFERRYAALKENDKHRGDRAYFKALNRQMTEGGVEAMFYDLQKVALEDSHPREIPLNPAPWRSLGRTTDPNPTTLGAMVSVIAPRWQTPRRLEQKAQRGPHQ